MAGNDSWRGVCYCLLSGFLLILGLGSLILRGMSGSGGGSIDIPEVNPDTKVCNAIKGQQPFMMKINNVTISAGSLTKVICKVVKSGSISNQRIFWTGPGFKARGQIELFSEFNNIKVFQPQTGVDVTGKGTMETFHCGGRSKISGMVSTTVQIFTLLFNPVNPAHEGWYTCMSNFTATATIPSGNLINGNAYFMEEKFYLNVV